MDDANKLEISSGGNESQEKPGKFWNSFAPNLRGKQPATRIDSIASILYSDTIHINPETGEQRSLNDDTKGIRLLEAGVRPDISSGIADFFTEYQHHKERNFTPEYTMMVETVAQDIISSKNLESMPVAPFFFVGMPSRGEPNTKHAFETVFYDFPETSWPFCIVYHNDTKEPTVSTLADLKKIRSNPHVYVLDRKVDPSVVMGDIRGLLEDVTSEVASRLHMHDPILVMTDADVQGVSSKYTFDRLVAQLRHHPRRLLSYGLTFFSESSINKNPDFLFLRKISKVKDYLLDSRGYVQRGPVGQCTAVRLSAVCAVGGSPRVNYGEDKLLGEKIVHTFEQQRIEFNELYKCLVPGSFRTQTYTELKQVLQQNLGRVEGVQTTLALLEDFYAEQKDNEYAIGLPDALEKSLQIVSERMYPPVAVPLTANNGYIEVDGSKDVAAFEKRVDRYDSADTYMDTIGGDQRKKIAPRIQLKNLFRFLHNKSNDVNIVFARESVEDIVSGLKNNKALYNREYTNFLPQVHSALLAFLTHEYPRLLNDLKPILDQLVSTGQ